ncbi:hypothetical protein O181_025123 [Austropuccinia psidii MF-1]|uniref:Uncharacterized protein n=1 Tax=Austropuccinia psidii MF-1 TaxID=1389203 RepID=A0A9Q3GYU0_9BASI|nr:hypothetical protein [Austropuccinia psidii MF-1]
MSSIYSKPSLSRPTNVHDSDSDDDGVGFQIYKDHPSETRYTQVAPAQPARSTHQSSLLPPFPQPQIHPRYRQSQIGPSTPLSNDQSNQTDPSYNPYTPTDLVAMPTLGSDWDRREAKQDKDWDGKEKMIDSSKWLERKNEVLEKKSQFANNLKAFLAGDRKLFGRLSRLMALALLVFVLILAALLCFFLVPRLPFIAYNNQTPLTSDNSGLSFRRTDPVDFQFNAQINLAMKAPSSFIKPKAKNIYVTISDLSSTDSAVQVASGTLSKGVSVGTKDFTPFTVDLKFQYTTKFANDSLWTAWYAACAHKWPGKEDRPTLQLGIIVQWETAGRAETSSERTILSNVTCPAEIPASGA